MKLYKYCGINTALKIINNGYIELSQPRWFNDPYDSLQHIIKIKYMYEELKENIDNLAFKYNIDVNEIENHINTVGYNIFKISDFRFITCFSKSWNNILMWSHYAQEHSGVCMEFDFNCDIMQNITKVRYINEITNIQNKINKDPFQALFLKHKNWSYEQEYRYTRSINYHAANCILAGVNSYIEENLNQTQINEYRLYRDQLFPQINFCDDNKLMIIPSRIIIGSLFFDISKANRFKSIELGESKPLVNMRQSGNVAPVNEYKAFTLLDKCLELKINIEYTISQKIFSLEKASLTPEKYALIKSRILSNQTFIATKNIENIHAFY